jgi:hypothetical protein
MHASATPFQEQHMVIKRVDPVSCAKITGTLYAAIGLIFGAIFSMVALAGGMASDSSNGTGMGALFGVGAIIVFPICYGIIGFVGTLIVAALYNVVANAVGGIRIDVE